jgi:hypothetical protein
MKRQIAGRGVKWMRFAKSRLNFKIQLHLQIAHCVKFFPQNALKNLLFASALNLF